MQRLLGEIEDKRVRERADLEGIERTHGNRLLEGRRAREWALSWEKDGY